MKLTRKIIATIVVILSLVMTFTGCEMLDDILGQISGTPAEHQCENWCTECGKCTDLDCEEDICAEKCEGHNQGSENAEIKTGTAYKFGMAQGNKGGDIYYLSGGTASTYYLATSSNILEAVDVYVEEANGGYHLYYEKGGKHYINVEKVKGSDGYDHVNAVIADTAVTVYTYNTELKTLTVTINDVSYALGTRNDKEYTTVGPCDISKDPFVCTFHIYEGANPGGGTGTDENGKFDLNLIPEPDFNAAGFDGYYVVNNNVPFFTDAEKEIAILLLLSENYQIRTSGSNRIPVASNTLSDTWDKRFSTSSAVAPSRFTANPACFVEIAAPPTRKPLSPVWSMSAAA